MMACHGELHQELLAVTRLAKEGGGGYDMDALEQVHNLLMDVVEQEAGEEGEATAAGSPVASLGAFSPLRSVSAPASMKQVVGDMASRPLGRALLRHAAPIHALTKQAVSYGPGYLLDYSRLAALMGPLGQQLASADLLADAFAALSVAASQASARLAALQAASALVVVLSKDSQPVAGQGQEAPAGALVALATSMATACVSELVRWSSDEAVQLLKAPWAGLSSLLADSEEAAVCTSRLLLHAINGTKGGQAPPARADSLSTPLGKGVAGKAPAATAATSAVPETACMQLSTTFASWLRMLQRGTLQGATVRSVTDYLASALLCALQCNLGGPHAKPAPAGADGGGADSGALDHVLVDLLPLVCDACKAGGVNVSVGTQVILVLASHLPPVDWLPVLQSKLDITAMLASAASAASTRGDVASKEGMDGDLGMLELALTVAKTREGAAWLHECGVLDYLKGLVASLLSADGGRLAAFGTITLHPGNKPGETLPLVRPPCATEDGAGPDTANAYAGGAQTAVHKQWVVLLSFAAALLRTLSQYVDVEQAAIELLGVAESRMLLTCLPPRADASQPLTLASLLELERVLFLLTHMAKYTGMWHLLLPSSLPKFRTAVTSFIAFAAANGSSSKPVTLECPPQSAEEVRLAGQAAGLPKTEGWFRVCFLGASDPGGLLVSKAGGSTGAPTTPARPGMLALAAGPSTATPGAGQTVQTAMTTSTEYSARMAESMYACILHALVFLRATAPQVGEGEAALLGPTWPKPRELASLQEQALEALYAVADAPRGAGDTRRTRVLNNLLRVLQLLCDFLGEVGCPSSASRHMNAKLSSQLQMLEELLKSGKSLPQRAALVTPMSPSHSFSSPGLDVSMSGGLSGGLSSSLPERGLSGGMSMSVSQVGA